jgi:hypothetical protein
MQAFSRPFRAFVLVYGFIYPVWLFSAPGTPGTMDGADYVVLERLAVGYLFTSLAFIFIAVAHLETRNWRGAIWSIIFAILALGIAASSVLHPYYR